MSKKQAKKITRKQYRKPAPKAHKPMTKQTKLIIAALTAALVVAGVLFALLYNDGSLKLSDGAIVGAEDSWIIVDKVKNANNPKYFKLGEVTGAVDGFYLNPEETIKQNTLATDFYGRPEDEGNAVSFYYITGVNKAPAEIAASVHDGYLSYGNEGELSDVTTIELAGKQMTYFIFRGKNTSITDGSVGLMQSMVGYLPSRGMSILASITVTPKAEEGYLSEEELLSLAEKIAATIDIGAE